MKYPRSSGVSYPRGAYDSLTLVTLDPRDPDPLTLEEVIGLDVELAEREPDPDDEHLTRLGCLVLVLGAAVVFMAGVLVGLGWG